MSDYINRADAVEAVRQLKTYLWTKYTTDEEILVIDKAETMTELMLLPSADAVHGEWIEVEDYNGDVHYKCDQCGEEWTFPYGTPEENNANFCPNCGARMKGGDTE